MQTNDNGIAVHFIGIGGAGMSALAKYLIKKGFNVSGSDKAGIKTLEELSALGANVVIRNSPCGESAAEKLVASADVVVKTSAIKIDDSELVLAEKLKKPVLKRSELLGEILSVFPHSVGVGGTHGKTTATAMLSGVFSLFKPFTSFIGGSDYTFGNFHSDNGSRYAISEVCEYDGNIYDIKTETAVVLNVDGDHLDSYKTMENLKAAFFDYLDRAALRIVNNDDFFLKQYGGKRITYSISNSGDFTAVDLLSSGGKYSFDCVYKGKKEFRAGLNVYGRHNVYNALAAVAVCKEYGIDNEKIVEGIEKFSGVKRRFEFIGEKNGIKFIADYCHHPEEIKATLKTADEVFVNGYSVVFQPHTYSRTKLLFSDFVKAFSGRNVILLKEYAAREVFDYDGSSQKLAEEIKNAAYAVSACDAFDMIMRSDTEKPVLILGAGDIYDKFVALIKG